MLILGLHVPRLFFSELLVIDRDIFNFLCCRDRECLLLLVCVDDDNCDLFTDVAVMDIFAPPNGDNG